LGSWHKSSGKDVGVQGLRHKDRADRLTKKVDRGYRKPDPDRGIFPLSSPAYRRLAHEDMWRSVAYRHQLPCLSAPAAVELEVVADC